MQFFEMLNNHYHWQQMLTKVDIIPTSLILAEASYRSANYSKALSRKTYNLFNLVCYMADCGLPLKQVHGNPVFNTVEFSGFSSLLQAIYSFNYELSLSPRYQDFRLARAKARKRDEPLNGYQLIGCDKKHPKVKSLYNKQICELIKRYRLTRYDKI